jgi:hypothetical protein
MNDAFVEDLDVNEQDSAAVKGGAFDAFQKVNEVPMDQLSKKLNIGAVGTPDTRVNLKI